MHISAILHAEGENRSGASVDSSMIFVLSSCSVRSLAATWSP
ncbi:hypothetical protein ACFQ0P_08575 [Microbacterium insulae]|uniref:Uncharacterized protein n=1 Tax=Microbacterium insulae TaxID=483014 RepID=A0ABW3AHJ6_9MICO